MTDNKHTGAKVQLYTLNGIESAIVHAGNGVAVIRSTQSKTAIAVNWGMVDSRVTEYGEEALFYAC